MTDRIKKAIDIFLDAINNQTLASGTCSACAVGNLIAHELGVIPKVEKLIEYASIIQPQAAWISVKKGASPKFSQGKTHEEVIELMKSTGFSVEELLEIEKAFEDNTYINFAAYPHYAKEEIKKDQIRGLKAAIEVMKNFDKVEFSTQEEFVDKVVVA